MAPESNMPEWLEPMAATLTQDRFSGPGWLFERKFDGIRLLAYKRGAIGCRNMHQRWRRRSPGCPSRS
jgi:ATP-dependent DNA ligase